MVFFITVLRAMAACLITNAHYEGIYPTDILANGGLLGDVLFFAVSGYCLANVTDIFPKWYGRRLIRCYLPVIIITIVYFLLGFYSFGTHGFVWWFIYPTNYHFIASIVLLYIPYYFIMRIPKLRQNILAIMGVLALACIAVYLIFYDRSYYHIDTVREPMIEFLYMESMLLGAWFKERDGKCRNHWSWWNLAGMVVCLVGYFTSKMIFARSSGEGISQFQILNWVMLLALLFFIFRTFSGLDGKLEKWPKAIKKAVTFIADMTLEIYVVQIVIIGIFRPLLGFPLNWIVITAAILAAAWVLHIACKWLLGIAKRGRK